MKLGGTGRGFAGCSENRQSQVRGVSEVVQYLVTVSGVVGELVKRGESKMITKLGAQVSGQMIGFKELT